MNEADIIRMVRHIIRQELAPILMGKVVSTEAPDRVTLQRYSNESPIEEVRNIQPYGVASRPPEDMQCLTIPIGGDPTHLNMVGQFDEDRPDVGAGEVCFYGPMGQEIWMGNDGKIKSGSDSASSPQVLGDVLQTFVTNVLNAILNAPQIGTCAVGPVVLDPSIRIKLMQELALHVNSPATNFLSLTQFVERGLI